VEQLAPETLSHCAELGARVPVSGQKPGLFQVIYQHEKKRKGEGISRRETGDLLIAFSITQCAGKPRWLFRTLREEEV
jgi:hypothetical protein